MAFGTMAFEKMIKSNQKGDILTYLKLGNFWNWIDSVVKYPNKRHLYKKPRYQIIKKWKSTSTIPFIKKSAIQYKNVSKSQIGVPLQFFSDSHFQHIHLWNNNDIVVY